MRDMPSQSAVAAWTRIIRASRSVVGAIEGDVKEAGFPPLSWYDVLLELSRAPDGRLSPGDLESRTLFAQYNLSRLVDRLEAEKLVRRVSYPGDKRRHFVEITGGGTALRETMWPIYAAAIERRLGALLSEEEAGMLAKLLDRIIRPSSAGTGSLKAPDASA
jgi:DNA-binding MarR family transcriptional regulator